MFVEMMAVHTVKRWQFLLASVLLITLVHGETKSPKKRVCVIGAGPAGLTSIKQLADHPDEFEPVAFEQNADLGGQWLYTDDTDFNEHGLPVHSAVYKNLRQNGPKELTHFPDYNEFHGENRSYVMHTTFLQYLQNYTEHFHLRQYIQFNTLVEKVYPITNTKWHVDVRNLDKNEKNSIECDSVMICNGHFFKPYIPEIPGIESFPGKVIHSHAYRKPDEYVNKTIVILGASSSAVDISIELSAYAKKIYMSHRGKTMQVELPKNLEQVRGVIRADRNQLILSDGSRIEAEMFIFCTGYLYDYPFLDASSGIKVIDGKQVYPVYKHIVNVNRPSMAFIGLLQPALPIPLAYVQAHYYVSVLRGKVQLPSYNDMLESSQLPPGVPVKKAHDNTIGHYDYYNDLAKASGAIPLSSFTIAVSKKWGEQILGDPLHFKGRDLHVHLNGTIEYVPRKD